MTLKEQVDLLLPDKVRKKKFDDLEEKDWMAAQQVIKLLFTTISVKEKVVKIKDNPAALMYEVLSKKNAEMMETFEDAEFRLSDSGKVGVLQDWMDKCVKYATNLLDLKKMAESPVIKTNVEPGHEEQDEEETHNEEDYLSPEQFAIKNR